MILHKFGERILYGFGFGMGMGFSWKLMRTIPSKEEDKKKI